MTESLKIEFELDCKQNLYVKGEGQTCRLCLSEGASFKIFNEDSLLVDKIQRCCELEVFSTNFNFNFRVFRCCFFLKCSDVHKHGSTVIVLVDIGLLCIE